MAKNKSMNVKDLVLKVVTILASVMCFVALAFKFAFQKVGNISKSVSLKEWFDSFEALDKLKVDGIQAWKTAKVFLIITLVLVAIVAILAIIKFFVSNKYIDIVLAVVSGLAIVSTIVMTICLLVGNAKISDAMSTSLYKVSFGPHAGAACIIIFGLISGVAGGLLAMQKKFN